MSKEAIEKLRADLAVDRATKFQARLADLLHEMSLIEQADEFILAAQQTPAQVPAYA